VRIEYTPINLLRAEMAVEMDGVESRKYRFVRHRNGPRHTFDGPDVYGNSMGYGRALYTSQHFYGQALKVKGREFLIDDAFTLSAVWQWFKSDKLRYTMFGVLEWNER
jgi:hypothetical protein